MKEHVLQVLSACAGSDSPGLGQGNLSARRRYDDSSEGAIRRFVHQVDVTESSCATCSSALRRGRPMRLLRWRPRPRSPRNRSISGESQELRCVDGLMR